MGLFEFYIGFLGIIVCVGVIARNILVPAPLLLVVAGMLISLLPHFPHIEIKPELVLNIFLPLLIYQISATTSWRDVKKNLRPIALLSVGHVLFITLVVAVITHAIIPGMTWPMAFVLGAVISPPDDVAIIAIAQKIQLPQRIITILTGEGLLNDATALILFRFALAAVITQQFSAPQAFAEFFTIIIAETAYGLALGYIIGELRMKIRDPTLEMMLSLLTPFLAYLPAVQLGGSGVLATVVTGSVIGHHFLERYSAEARLLARAIWDTIGFALQSVLFLLVGLNLRMILENIASIPMQQLLFYSSITTVTVIVGRFIWVFSATYLPRFFSKSLRKKDPYPPWQYPFVVSWAGMRGGISLAAALAVPTATVNRGAIDLKDLLIFLVFCIITATLLIQGLTLPWLLRVLGITKIGLREKKDEYLAELNARKLMTKAGLHWLHDYKASMADDATQLEEVKLQIREYQILKKRLDDMIQNHQENTIENAAYQFKCTVHIATQLIEIEKETLTALWHDAKISHTIRTKLLEQLDLHAKHLNA